MTTPIEGTTPRPWFAEERDPDPSEPRETIVSVYGPDGDGFIPSRLPSNLTRKEAGTMPASFHLPRSWLDCCAGSVPTTVTAQVTQPPR